MVCKRVCVCVCVCARARASVHAETLTIGRTFGSAFVKQNQSQTTVKAMKIDFPQELLHRSQHPSGLPSEPRKDSLVFRQGAV